MILTSWTKEVLFAMLGSEEPPVFIRNGVRFVLMGVERESGGGKSFNVKARRSDGVIETFFVRTA